MQNISFFLQKSIVNITNFGLFFFFFLEGTNIFFYIFFLLLPFLLLLLYKYIKIFKIITHKSHQCLLIMDDGCEDFY